MLISLLCCGGLHYFAFATNLIQFCAFYVAGSGRGKSGVILPPPDFITESVDAVRAAGGVYIADEVQTGFGRLGSTFWAFEQSHNHDGGVVVPDIVTVGKPFGNGMSLGAVITTREIADRFDGMGVEYFNTFGGNPVSAAAGLAVMDILKEESLQEHAMEVGKYLRSRFWQVQADHFEREVIGDIRGSGLFLGIDLVRDTTSKDPAAKEASFICTTLKQRYSILTSIDGIHDNVLVIKPPLVFSKADADYLVESFAGAVGELMSLGADALKAISKTPT
jgi:ethanolamine-phosphate phospho-lyase